MKKGFRIDYIRLRAQLGRYVTTLRERQLEGVALQESEQPRSTLIQVAIESSSLGGMAASLIAKALEREQNDAVFDSNVVNVGTTLAARAASAMLLRGDMLEAETYRQVLSRFLAIVNDCVIVEEGTP